MLYTIPGDIELLRDDSYACVIVKMDPAEAFRMLACLVGLEMQQLDVFQIASDSGTIKFTRKERIVCHVTQHGEGLTDALSDNQVEVFKCCCLDSILQKYPHPHVDVELKSFDFTLMIR